MAYVPIKETWKIEGFAELEQQLLDLAKGVRADLAARNTLVKAAKVAMQPVALAVQATAPFDESPRRKSVDKHGAPIPHLRETVRLDARIPNGRDVMSEYVSETDAAIAVVSVKKSAVSLAQEFSTRKIPAQPFLRPALESRRREVVDALKPLVASFIVDYAKKLARKKA